MPRGASAVPAPWLALGALAVLCAASSLTRSSARAADDTRTRAPALVSVALCDFDGDPTGEAARLDARARALLEGRPGRPPDPAAAAAAWMDMADARDAGLLEVPPVPYGARGLWWPAREVALLRLAALPAPGRDAVEGRWGPRAAALLAEAGETGDESALERAVEAGPCTRAGGDALVLLADRDLERGDAGRAVARLARWVRLHPAAPPARRASVGARLLDARAAARDGLGAIADFRALLDVALVPVRRGAETTALHEVVESAIRRAHALASTPARTQPPPAVDPPAAAEALWSLPLQDAAEGDAPAADPLPSYAPLPDAPPPPATVSVAAGSVWIAGPLSVRRVAPDTGRVVWRFPAEPPARGRDLVWTPPTMMPARGVAVSDGRVFAVLGDSTTPSSRVRARRLGLAGEDGRESRARLVALDASTGRLLWHTGAPDEADPVLGARDVSVSSPPTVDGDRVWATLSARRGAVECWLASFDAKTGAARTITYLGRGESGLQGPAPQLGVRWFVVNEQGAPAGQAPSRAGDEVCAAPGAGFAAGVRASDGRLLWVQALPAYRWGPPSSPQGFGLRGWTDESARTQSAENVPLFGHGSWFVAASGSPAPAALESGTGRLRWAGANDDLIAPPARAVAKHLLRVAPDSRGVPRLLLGGGDQALLRYDGEKGHLDDLGPGLSPGGRPVGKPWLGDGRAVVLLDRRTRVVRFGVEGPAVPTEAPRPTDSDPWPAEGDLLRAGDTWLVVGQGRVVAITSTVAAAGIAATDAVDPRDRAARVRLAFRRAPTLDAFDRAATAAAVAGDADSARELLAAFRERLGTSPALRAEVLSGSRQGLRRARLALDRVAASERAPGYLALVDLLRKTPDGDEALVELCLHWAAFGAAGECSPPVEPLPAGARPTDRPADEAADSRTQRGDLAARRLLRDAVLRDARAAAVLAAAERASLAGGARTVGPAGEAPEPWTASAWVDRARVLGAAIDGGRFAEAAAVAADLRLAPPPATRIDPACAQALRALEADAVAREGEVDAARDRLHDALASPAGAARGAFGLPAATLAATLAARSPFIPAPAEGEPEAIEVEPPETAPPLPAGAAAARVRAVPVVLEPCGPGAVPSLSRALIAREDGIDVRDVTSGALVGTCPPREGTVGFDLLDAEEYVRGPGALVRTVAVGRPADAAGLREGDWIVAWDGTPVSSRREVERLVASTAPGRTVEVRRVRDGREGTASVRVAARPFPSEGAAEPGRAWMRSEDEAVVLDAYALLLLDLRDASARPLWTAGDGPATATFAGFADALYVTRGTREFDACSLTAIDARTGRERWTAPLSGPARGEPRVLGSAVVVDVQSPEATLVFDAAVGVRRAAYARVRAAPQFGWRGTRRRDPAPSVDAVGTTLLLSEGASTRAPRGWGRIQSSSGRIVAVNPTTGDAAWEQSTGDALAQYFSYFDAGGVVALAVSAQQIDVYVPDLVGGLVAGRPIEVRSEKMGMYATSLEILSNTKLCVRGDVVHLVRSTDETSVSVSAIEIDRDALARGKSAVLLHQTQAVFGPTVGTSTQGPTPGKNPRAVHARATLDGCFVLSTFADADEESAPGRATWYEPLRGDARTHVGTRLVPSAGPGSARTGAVTIVGSTALVPIDRGFLRVPLEPAQRRDDRRR